MYKRQDIAIIATGLMVNEARMAAEQLAAEGIHARVINIHTIKPVSYTHLSQTLHTPCAPRTRGSVPSTAPPSPLWYKVTVTASAVGAHSRCV